MPALRVLTLEGLVPSTGALLTRNVFRIIDSMPVFYVVGLLFVFFGRQHLRLGDIAAGTVLAVDRAPFLEKLARWRRDPTAHGEWRAARQRAAALSRRRGTDVDDALAVVDDYRRAAHALATSRQTTRSRVAPRNTWKRCIPICTTPFTGPRAASCSSFCP